MVLNLKLNLSALVDRIMVDRINVIVVPSNPGNSTFVPLSRVVAVADFPLMTAYGMESSFGDTHDKTFSGNAFENWGFCWTLFVGDDIYCSFWSIN